MWSKKTNDHEKIGLAMMEVGDSIQTNDVFSQSAHINKNLVFANSLNKEFLCVQ